ncbi:MAG: hypothetical protein ACFB03_18755 [Paracoccaceae bacterium]
MKSTGVFVVLFAVMATLVHAQPTQAPQKPELRVDASPAPALATNGYIDGQIVLRVQLLSRHPFEALDFKLPQIANAEVVELMRPRTRKVTGYAGQGFVFETSIAVFPQRSGVLTIPPVTAVGFVQTEPDGELQFDLASDPVEIKIAGISRHYDNPWWLVSDRVEIEETWSTPPDEIRVGELVRRTVSLRVWGVDAERLPELKHGRTRGVRVSLAGSDLKTKKSPDGLVAHATYSWDLEAEPQQVAFVTPIALDYWDPSEHRQRKAALPALRLEPLPADSEKIAADLMQEATQNREQSVTITAVLAGALSLPVCLAFGAFLLTRLPTPADRRLRATVKDNSATGLYKAVENWLSQSKASATDFDRGHASRLKIARHLFEPGHPDGASKDQVVSDAYRFSRQRRLARLLDRLSNLWYS